ncbi:hypothetical protein [Tellurirhabdus rosea]|uniref:hypothetical protein n=1 Tax=Tellurirhabdus rosea TaxID=2674997 RepID=UPI002253D7E7|nr:hypothetical protein [Tellurirhabdus rosea]
MKTMKKMAALLLVLGAAFGCQDKAEVQPQQGTYLIYTNMPVGKFDNLTVRVNDKEVGRIGQPFVGTVAKPTPDCDTKTGVSVIRIQRPEGSYSLDAVATLNGKQTGKWSSSLRFETGDCKRTRLVYDN